MLVESSAHFVSLCVLILFYLSLSTVFFFFCFILQILFLFYLRCIFIGWFYFFEEGELNRNKRNGIKQWRRYDGKEMIVEIVNKDLGAKIETKCAYIANGSAERAKNVKMCCNEVCRTIFFFPLHAQNFIAAMQQRGNCTIVIKRIWYTCRKFYTFLSFVSST